MDIVIVALPYIQIILAVCMTVGILLQSNAAGIGGALGGGDSFGSIEHTRRGLEKVVFNATVIAAILFVITSIISFIY
jgi:preprotein translocase subunit SecG